LWRQHKPAHGFQCGGSILFSDYDTALWFRIDPSAPADVLAVEHLVCICLGRRRTDPTAGRADRFEPNSFSPDIDQLLLRLAQRRQLAAENTASVDAERVVDPVTT
jgi:hypothetical protein